jgi:hypothetical protein
MNAIIEHINIYNVPFSSFLGFMTKGYLSGSFLSLKFLNQKYVIEFVHILFSSWSIKNKSSYFAKSFAQQYNMIDAIETSAKENTNVEQVFKEMATVSKI